MAILHVTNGDHAAEGLGHSGLGGSVLPWRDVLHDGPVIDNVDRAAFRDVRADFLASRSWDDQARVLDTFAARDAQLEAAGAGDEVVLWFEPDLYDQLQLLDILSRLGRMHAAERPRVSIVPVDHFLGDLEAARFAPLWQARRALGAEDCEMALLAWKAFVAPDPTALVEVTRKLSAFEPARSYANGERFEQSNGDEPRLPHLAAALVRWLEELPSSENGLSRCERQVCQVLENGPRSLAYLFEHAHGDVESWAWLGDLSFAWYVERLSDCRTPLVLFDNGARIVAPRGGKDARSFFMRNARLTDAGRDVLRGAADAIALNGIDRWYGGTHLTTASHWRWQERSGSVARG